MLRLRQIFRLARVLSSPYLTRLNFLAATTTTTLALLWKGEGA